MTSLYVPDTRPRALLLYLRKNIELLKMARQRPKLPPLSSAFQIRQDPTVDVSIRRKVSTLPSLVQAFSKISSVLEAASIIDWIRAIAHFIIQQGVEDRRQVKLQHSNLEILPISLEFIIGTVTRLQ